MGNCWELLVELFPSVSEQIKKQLTPYQNKTLLKRFEAKPYLEQGEKAQLAMSLNISETKIAQWFHHKRKMKRKKGLLGKHKYLE